MGKRAPVLYRAAPLKTRARTSCGCSAFSPPYLFPRALCLFSSPSNLTDEQHGLGTEQRRRSLAGRGRSRRLRWRSRTRRGAEQHTQQRRSPTGRGRSREVRGRSSARGAPRAEGGARRPGAESSARTTAEQGTAIRGRRWRPWQRMQFSLANQMPMIVLVSLTLWFIKSDFSVVWFCIFFGAYLLS